MSVGLPTSGATRRSRFGARPRATAANSSLRELPAMRRAMDEASEAGTIAQIGGSGRSCLASESWPASRRRHVPAPGGRGDPEAALESTGEGGLGLVADLLGDARERRV